MEPTCRVEEHGNDGSGGAGVRAESYGRAARMLHAAGDEARLRLMVRLSEGETCVTELAAESGEGMSTISQRLKVLRSEGLVSGRREGKHVYYSLADRHVYDVILSILAHADE
ncbi:ArsR/SmtB family transcription factor [Rubrobacter indicoceani]|uniref:ArsR/SmtB family transcription factor n=1 Tax=Rubrobacter indicoceani TaxID=2051957 RepID=UPI001968B7EA|nr:metalloregulator ArsR/SmtB family transcription factor [Rubrobacter indicoceani]